MRPSTRTVISPALLEARDVSIRYGGVKAVTGASLRVYGGEVVALIGPNGAGKTSLFNAIAGVVKPTSGSVRFAGRPMGYYAPHERARLGMARTFQHAELFQRLTLRENLILACYGSGRSGILSALVAGPRARRDREGVEARATQVLDATDLAEFAAIPCAELPYGIQRLATVARAIAVHPQILLLDEPSAGLSPAESEELGRMITRIRDLLGVPVLLIEHDMDLVMGIADYVYVLDFGLPLAQGAPEDVKRNPDVISAYLGADESELHAAS